ncbi:MAG: polysaccharide biosynthesis/export family protein [Pseudomonadota bacterium]
MSLGRSALSATLLFLTFLVAPLSASATQEYRIGPEDILQISVWKEEGLDREVLVRPDGGVSFPLAGDVPASGRTPLEVQTDIKKRLERYIPEAVVTVSVKKISGYTVFVIGQVKKPGQFVLGRYVDVIQALTLAGGLTPYASESKITVLRRTGEEEEVFKFDFADVKSGRGLEQNIILRSGDVVVVP